MEEKLESKKEREYSRNVNAELSRNLQKRKYNWKIWIVTYVFLCGGVLSACNEGGKKTEEIMSDIQTEEKKDFLNIAGTSEDMAQEESMEAQQKQEANNEETKGILQNSKETIEQSTKVVEQSISDAYKKKQ